MMSCQRAASALAQACAPKGGRTIRWARMALRKPQRPFVAIGTSFLPVGTDYWESRSADFTSSNFTYESSAVDTGVRHRCRRWGWNTDTGADPFPLTPTNQVTMVHQPWAVTWAASDTATLTPKLPTITSSMIVPIWTPGQTIPGGIWDDKGQDNGVQIDGGFLAVIIALPILGFLVTCCLIWCCARACYKKRKERRIVYIVDGTIPPTAHAMDTQTQNR